MSFNIIQGQAFMTSHLDYCSSFLTARSAPVHWSQLVLPMGTVKLNSIYRSINYSQCGRQQTEMGGIAVEKKLETKLYVITEKVINIP